MHAPAYAGSAVFPALDLPITHARELAAYIEERRFGAAGDGLHFSPTDAALAARALRSFARRRGRRAIAAIFVAAALLASALVGIAVRNRDGRVDWHDIAAVSFKK